MMKKAVGLIAALALALTGTSAAFADAYTDTEASSASQEVQTEASEEENGGVPAAQTEDEVCEFAEENEDPQLGKYLASLDEPQTVFSDLEKECGGGEDSARSVFGYTNDSLIHNSRFDSMDKVWGIDVSYFQYDIDWEKVKADGIDYAIIRVGYRGYGTGGQLVKDYKFDQNMKGAIDAGLEVGVYFYTQAINTKEAVEEADFVLSYIKNYDLDMPVYFDIESVDYDSGRLDEADLSKSEMTALCTAFCDRIEANGYEAGVYANKYWLLAKIDGEALGKKYPIWLAHYTTQTDYAGVYNTWQFTGSGKVSGINTAVDIDVDYRNGAGDIDNFNMTLSGSNGVFRWDAVNNATRYEFFRYDPQTGSYTRMRTTTSTQVIIALANGNYGYCVRAVRVKDGKTIYGDYSDIIYASKNKVVNLTADVTSNSLSLNWSRVPNASGYEIYCSKTAGADAAYTRYKNTFTNSFSLKGLKPGAYYSFKIRPYFINEGKKNYGEFSDILSVTIKPEKLGVLKHSSSTQNSVSVSWTGVDYADGYQIAMYNSSTKQYDVKATMGSSARSAVISGLNSASSYRLAVRAYVVSNGVRCYGDFSSYKTCGTAPAVPTGVYTSANSSTITVSWDKVNGAASYTLYSKENGSYTAVKTLSDTSVSFDNPKDGTAKTYVVKASVVINSKSLSSGYSAESVIPANAPAKPVVTSSSSTAGTVKLKWTASAGASGYRIYKYDDVKKTYVKVSTIYKESNTSYTVKGLDASSQYKFKVKAFTKTGTGIFWGDASSAYSVFTAKK